MELPDLFKQAGWEAGMVRKQLGGKDPGSAADHGPNTLRLCQAVVVKRVQGMDSVSERCEEQIDWCRQSLPRNRSALETRKLVVSGVINSHGES